MPYRQVADSGEQRTSAWMPYRDLQLTEKDGSSKVEVLFSGLQPNQWGILIGPDHNAIRSSLSRRISHAGDPDEDQLCALLKNTMQTPGRSHLIPLLNVLYRGQHVILDGKVLPVGKRTAMDRDKFLKVTLARSQMLQMLTPSSSPAMYRVGCGIRIQRRLWRSR
jgi:hypothetical protein